MHLETPKGVFLVRCPPFIPFPVRCVLAQQERTSLTLARLLAAGQGFEGAERVHGLEQGLVVLSNTSTFIGHRSRLLYACLRSWTSIHPS